MKRLTVLGLIIICTTTLLLTGCIPGVNDGKTKTEVGTLRFTANGEDFVRQGFVTKDGWNLTFDHVYITLSEITGFQSDPPYEAEKDGEITAKETVKLEGIHTVDLAAGDADAAPIVVGEKKAVPTGHYNALSWNIIKAPQGDSAGSSVVMVGKAEKKGQTVAFTIKLTPEFNFLGGEYIGDERKGFVTNNADSAGELEMTFHFDHLFGDGSLPEEDELNLGAFGFEPFAALSKAGQLEVSMDQLKDFLSADQYQTLLAVFPGLGHVGEGHCNSNPL